MFAAWKKVPLYKQIFIFVKTPLRRKKRFFQTISLPIRPPQNRLEAPEKTEFLQSAAGNVILSGPRQKPFRKCAADRKNPLEPLTE